MFRIRSQARLGPDCEHLLRQAVDRLSLSARSVDRILRVTRTISDLSDSEELKVEHLAEALHFRRTWNIALTPP
jgi:magnesium chelatase family protein